MTTNQYWYSGNWIPNGCNVGGTTFPQVCVQHDWALLVLPANAWNSPPNGTPGWMGYWTYDQTFIANNAVNNNDGYPSCFQVFSSSVAIHRTFSTRGSGRRRNGDGICESARWSFPAFYRTDRDLSPAKALAELDGLHRARWPICDWIASVGPTMSGSCAGLKWERQESPILIEE